MALRADILPWSILYAIWAYFFLLYVQHGVAPSGQPASTAVYNALLGLEEDGVLDVLTADDGSIVFNLDELTEGGENGQYGRDRDTMKGRTNDHGGDHDHDDDLYGDDLYDDLEGDFDDEYDMEDAGADVDDGLSLRHAGGEGQDEDMVRWVRDSLPDEPAVWAVLVGTVVAMHVVFILLCYWSVPLKYRVRFTPVHLLKQATHVFCIPPPHHGKAHVCALEQGQKEGKADAKVSGASRVQQQLMSQVHSIFFMFQERRYVLDTEASTDESSVFTHIVVPVKAFGVDAFMRPDASWVAFSSATHKALQNVYGVNELRVPVPTYKELMIVQVTSPFFVFQILCMALWSLQDYWVYSLINLGMMLMLEYTVVYRRISNHKEIGSMGGSVLRVEVLNEKGEWVETHSSNLVPGNIIAVPSRAPEADDAKDTSLQDDGDGKPAPFTLPCDALLLAGSAIANEAMLTGESVALMKEAVDCHKLAQRGDEKLKFNGSDARHILYGGTQVVSINGPTRNELRAAEMASNRDASSSSTSSSASNGLSLGKLYHSGGATVPAYVLRTGFDSSQGGLLRAILFSTDRVTGSTREAMLLILFLLVFACIAALYVYKHASVLPNQSSYRLWLECALTIASVVPAELPLELSFAVNTSLTALSGLAIFCTEPFRIPFAGKVTACCFDKTGTLTEDAPALQGLAGVVANKASTTSIACPTPIPLSDDVNQMTKLIGVALSGSAAREVVGGGEVSGANRGKKHKKRDKKASATVGPKSGDANIPFFSSEGVPAASLMVMGGCHSLASIDGEVCGDPLEMALFNGYGWRASNWDDQSDGPVNDATLRRQGQSMELDVVQRFHFSSALKRMSSIVRYKGKAGRDTYALVKGAPEIIRSRLLSVPESFDALCQQLTVKGARVIALAYKIMNVSGDVRSIDRDDVECELHFAGFAVFLCPLKPDSAGAVQSLAEGSHSVIMITGDAPLTACHAACAAGLLRDVKARTQGETVTSMSESIKEKGKKKTGKKRVNAWSAEVMNTDDHPLAICSVSVEAETRVDESKKASGDLYLPNMGDLVWKQVDGTVIGVGLKPADVAKRRGPPSGDGVCRPFKLVVTGPALSVLCDYHDQEELSDTMVGEKEEDETHGDDVLQGATSAGGDEEGGRAVSALRRSDAKSWLPHAVVYARTSPVQKAIIVMALRAICNDTVLMCGDGTNDVSALRRADVGVALLGASSVERVDLGDGVDASDPDQVRTALQPFLRAKARERAKKNREKMRSFVSGGGTSSGGGGLMASLSSAMQQQQDDGDGEAGVVKFGDASVAAPFTTKVPSLYFITHLVRQGRCTLVTTLHMFKMLALNCLLSSYSLSVLYMAGVKWGEYQILMCDLPLIAMSLSATNTKALKWLSPTRPPTKFFSLYHIGSVLGQFAVHLGLLFFVNGLVEEYETVEDRGGVNLKREFKPSLINTCVFVTTMATRLAVYAVNFRGLPWLEPLERNRTLKMSIYFAIGCVLSVALEIFPVLNTEVLKLVPLPSKAFSLTLTAAVVMDWVLCYLIEHGLDHTVGPRQDGATYPEDPKVLYCSGPAKAKRPGIMEQFRLAQQLAEEKRQRADEGRLRRG